jgi:hypothetical protein
MFVARFYQGELGRCPLCRTRRFRDEEAYEQVSVAAMRIQKEYRSLS